MLSKIIEELIEYAKIHLHLNEFDVIFMRNFLLHEFNLNEPYDGIIDKAYIESLSTPTSLINELKGEVEGISDNDIERIMSILSPRPSEVIRKFMILKRDSPKKACDYFYDLMIKNNYIKKDYISKNIIWDYENNNRKLEITINLSKPEKDNKDIAREKDLVEVDYPKCMLCDTNEGYYGSNRIQPRSNIRVIPMKLGGENWFMQYSPYAYYNEHCIVIDKIHRPMVVDKASIIKQIDFVDELPNYFIGSNSDLPIVGGSMLTHHHFQGGDHIMPMMHSRNRYNLSDKKYKDVEISYLDWFNSCILLKSKNKNSLINLADEILETYKNYSDESINLIANDEDGRHNTITTITRKVGKEYNLYLILRNNRCDEKRPDGIFHAQKEYHNIKKEGIGLIEAMGLFILPGRLKYELDLIADILSNSTYPVSDIIENNECLIKHRDFINKLLVKYRRHNKKEVAVELIKLEVGMVCEEILKNTGIFKDTIDGQLALMRFFKKLNLEVLFNEQS